MKTYELFIGQNNDTKELELSKIENILNNNFEGYTIKECTGVWQGEKEKSVSVTIMANIDKLREVLRTMNRELDQMAIAFHEVAALEFFEER